MKKFEISIVQKRENSDDHKLYFYSFFFIMKVLKLNNVNNLH